MGEITGGSDRVQIGKFMRQADALRVNLQGHFWPLCGMIGGVLLFFLAAAVVPPWRQMVGV
jgi:hypothetical protein